MQSWDMRVEEHYNERFEKRALIALRYLFHLFGSGFFFFWEQSHQFMYMQSHAQTTIAVTSTVQLVQ